MTDTQNDFDRLEDLWKNQEVTEVKVDIESMVKNAEKLRRQVTVRNIMEWTASAFLLAWCLAQALRADEALEAASYVAMALGAIFVAGYLFMYGRAGRLPDPSTDTVRYAEAHRDQLLSQARLLRRAPLWYLAPLALGAIGMVAHAAIEVSNAGKGMWIVAVIGLAVVLVFTSVGILNLRKAAKLRTRADALDLP